MQEPKVFVDLSGLKDVSDRLLVLYRAYQYTHIDEPVTLGMLVVKLITTEALLRSMHTELAHYAYEARQAHLGNGEGRTPPPLPGEEGDELPF